ncbi:MAG: hypothetical protein LBC53_02995 [Spirochaetaceae bacterium]|jgi:hypothetical protein|nr:hypothetical protein [Spirochaetaceae bacterium]
MNKKSVFLTVTKAALVVLAVSCAKLDVVASYSEVSFENILRNLPQTVTQDPQYGAWSLSAPDGGARFLFDANYAALRLDASPFIAAGLDPSKAPAGDFSVKDGEIVVEAKLEGEARRGSALSSPLSGYHEFARLHRGAIGYHAALNHYGVSLGGGFLFEWAKDIESNDKDIVFALNPEPFAAAGADVSNINGWNLSSVTADDENGKPIQADKLLKAFNLK